MRLRCSLFFIASTFTFGVTAGGLAAQARGCALDTGSAQTAARAFASSNWQQRVFAVELFGRLGDVHGLERAMHDRHPLVRRAACLETGPLGQACAPIVASLAARLRDGDREVRSAAALALGWTRLRDDRAIRALLDAVEARSDRERSYVITSLGELRGTRHDQDIVAALTQRLGDGSLFVREAARRSLSWILRDRPEHALAVLGALRATDWRMRRGACETLEAVFVSTDDDAAAAEAQQRVRRALQEATQDSYILVRKAATLALALADAQRC